MTEGVHGPCRHDPPPPLHGVLGPGPDLGGGTSALAKASEVLMTRCPIHGIAYDVEREVCPECAKGPA
jgi:hypothetical protein